MKTLTRWTRSIFEYFVSSISKKIIIPYALLTLMLAVFGVFVVTRLVAGSFEARLKNQLIQAGQVVSDETVNRERFRLEVQRSVVNTIGVPEAIIERNLDQLEGLVSPLVANSQNIDSIVLLDTQGRELLRLQRKDPTPNAPVQVFKGSGVSFFNWEAVEAVLSDSQGQTKDVQLARDPQSDELIIYTVGPVRTAEGTVGAALVGTYLQKEIGLLHNMALAEIILFDESGAVIASTFSLDADESAAVFNFFTPTRYRQVIDQQDVTLLDQVDLIDEMDNRGQMYRLAYTPFLLRDRISGVYGVALPTNFITDTNNLSRNRLAVVFSVGVVAVFLVGYMVSRRIITPIIQLVQTSRAITAGDLSRRTELDSRDEIGILARTFDHMTAELQRLLKIQQEEASKLNAILNSIADGVIVQDAAGEIVVMNPAAKQILEKMEREEISLSSPERIQPQANNSDDIPHLLTDLTSLEFHETQRFEMGQQVLSALSAPVMTPDQQQSGAVVVLRDITREVESEKLKDDFITSISHELRTPLTAIKGYNDLLRMTGAGTLNEQQLQFIRIVDDNVADLLNLIQEMLDLSQIDAGSLGVDHAPLNLLELVETETDGWWDSMREHGLSFSVNLPPEPVWVEGDPLRLTRVLHNLLSNAQAYTLSGGQVAVSLKQVDGFAQVAVSDTGVGIAPENQRFLFTRFFRAIHDESTYDISGAGLGLYLSKAIIEAHYGEIWVETELNKGSTFSFKLSLLESPPANSVETEILEKVESRK